MKINSISIKNEGYVHCKSSFYSAQDGLDERQNYTFFPGLNNLIGEIDSGNWAVSYLLSMYKYRPEDFILFEQPVAILNGKSILLNELTEHSCYMDKIDPLFASDHSVKELVIKGLEYSDSIYSSTDIKDMFHISDERFDRTIEGVGNEIFKAMAAIGFAYGKEIYCFPWLSNNRFKYYHENLTVLLQTLESLGKTVILPKGIAT